MNYIKKPFIIILYGPTGVGKTDVALSLGRHIPIEIINMDVGQFYAPFSIGTAKPDWQNSTIPHHLFDIIDTQSHITVVAYRIRFLQLIDDICKRGKIPVVVGGSGFYLHSLFFIQESYNAEHNKERLLDNDAYPITWDELYRIDPDRAIKVDKNDTYRIERALYVWHSTHKKPTEFSSLYSPPAHFLLFHVIRDRQDLYRRINERVYHMIKQGWVNEVCTLAENGWSQFIQNKKLIGYNELLDYTKQNNRESLEKITERIQQRTRHYAKRQETFWKKIYRDMSQAMQTDTNEISGCIETISMTHEDSGMYGKKLAEQLMELIR